MRTLQHRRLRCPAPAVRPLRTGLVRGILLAAIVVLACTWRAEASWRIDPERFHVAAHGRLSCQECHGDVALRPVHPDPKAVNRRAVDFFKPQVCADCHEGAFEDVAAGSHGGVEASADQPLGACIACHDPHYAPTASTPAAALDLSQPPEVTCRRCHEFQAALPAPDPADETCLSCHRRPAASDPAEAKKTAEFCLSCHGIDAGKGARGGEPGYPVLDRASYAATPHGGISCLACHPEADRFGHSGQALGDCRSCHRPHPAATANEVHLNVACGACHLEGAVPVRPRNGDAVSWTRRKTGGPSDVHRMGLPDREQSCRQCHFGRNGVGAPAAVLPPKSILCMPCHAATFSAGDPTTLVALLVFAVGAAASASVWMSGRGASREAAGHPSKAGARQVLAGFFIDGLLQRRLFRHSKLRWTAHALVFLPFVFRFFWGLTAWSGSHLWPAQSWVWAMLDQTHPLTSFLFDLTGLAVLAGAGAMGLRRLVGGSKSRPAGLPPTDWPAYGLLGAIMVAGFFLEGLRIALSGYPQGSAYAFVGDALSRLFYGATGLDELYGYLWYGHAVLTGLFVAYLPFSRMFHIILAPVTLALRPLLTR